LSLVKLCPRSNKCAMFLERPFLKEMTSFISLFGVIPFYPRISTNCTVVVKEPNTRASRTANKNLHCVGSPPGITDVLTFLNKVERLYEPDLKSIARGDRDFEYWNGKKCTSGVLSSKQMILRQQ